jgi:hypothetical protein
LAAKNTGHPLLLAKAGLTFTNIVSFLGSSIMVLFLSKMVINQVLANQSPANTLDLNPGHRQKVD